MDPAPSVTLWVYRGPSLAGALHQSAPMTRFDRTWEPLFVLVAALVLLVGTL